MLVFLICWLLLPYLQLWDLHMESSPIVSFKIHEFLRPKVINSLISFFHLPSNGFCPWMG